MILRPVLDKQMKGMRMMKGKNFYTILLCAALMVAGTAACSDDWLSGADTSHDSSEEGQVAAVKLEGNGEVVSRSAFQAGTVYRLVMFTRGFTATDTSQPVLVGDPVLRYNGLATETALGTFQYLVVNDDRHINNDWFSFRSLEPIDDATKTETGRRSISFYGFTYGEETAPDLDADAYKRTETVVGGELKDLMWGILVDQNDATAKFPCEIPFRHAFSRLEFKVSQLASENNPEVGMYNLGIESIAVTGTYQSGTVDLFKGKTTLNGVQSERPLSNMATNYDAGKYISVDTPDSLGAMIVFPSAKESLSDGVEYTIGLKITLKGTEEEVKKLVGNATQSSSGDYYTGEYIVKQVYSSVYGGDDPTDDNGSIAASPLYLQAGSKYTLHIVLMKDQVRVVTVVPSKVEWLPGEKETDKDGNENTFSTEVVGQPIFFDNTMWMDRNLGANEADPGGNYNQTIGYYYQNNRNIPYWPYSFNTYGTSEYNRWDGSLTYSTELKGIPTPENRYDDDFSISSSWSSPAYKVYPIIDENAINTSDICKRQWYSSEKEKTYLTTLQKLSTYNSGTYIFFAGNGGDVPWKGNEWNVRENQPAPPGYALPTQKQFQSIFPTTVFAGNITFLKLQYDGTDWYGTDGTINSEHKVLRICVPFYKDGKNVTPNTGDKCYETWERLNDAGQSPGPDIYTQSPFFHRTKEPAGDPSSGYCSVYIISREGNDKGSITSLSSNYTTKEWGTIYGIKKVGTTEAYRMRWKVRNADETGTDPRLYVEVCMYSCTKDDNLTLENYRNYDWTHPVSQMFFPLCGEVEGRNPGSGPAAGFSSYGSAVLYATDSDAALHIKITGDNPQNQYMSVVSDEVQTNAKQIRLVKTQN